MEYPLRPVADMFRFNDMVFSGAIKNLPQDRWSRREHGANSLHWILGHMAKYRRDVARIILGDLPQASWEAGFVIGSKDQDSADWVAPEVLKEDFLSMGKRVEARLDSMTPAEAGAVAAHVGSGQPSTVAHNVQFLLWNESYHVGQICFLRRLWDLPGLA